MLKSIGVGPELFKNRKRIRNKSFRTYITRFSVPNRFTRKKNSWTFCWCTSILWNFFRQVVVILQDGSTPIKYGLTVDMEDRCSVIPPRLARLCGVAHHNLVLVEIIQSQVGSGWLVKYFRHLHNTPHYLVLVEIIQSQVDWLVYYYLHLLSHTGLFW